MYNLYYNRSYRNEHKYKYKTVFLKIFIFNKIYWVLCIKYRGKYKRKSKDFGICLTVAILDGGTMR